MTTNREFCFISRDTTLFLLLRAVRHLLQLLIQCQILEKYCFKTVSIVKHEPQCLRYVCACQEATYGSFPYKGRWPFLLKAWHRPPVSLQSAHNTIGGDEMDMRDVRKSRAQGPVTNHLHRHQMLKKPSTPQALPHPLQLLFV